MQLSAVPQPPQYTCISQRPPNRYIHLLAVPNRYNAALIGPSTATLYLSSFSQQHCCCRCQLTSPLRREQHHLAAPPLLLDSLAARCSAGTKRSCDAECSQLGKGRIAIVITIAISIYQQLFGLLCLCVCLSVSERRSTYRYKCTRNDYENAVDLPLQSNDNEKRSTNRYK